MMLLLKGYFEYDLWPTLAHGARAFIAAMSVYIKRWACEPNQQGISMCN